MSREITPAKIRRFITTRNNITVGMLVHHTLDNQDASVTAVDWRGPQGHPWVELAWLDGRGRMTGRTTWARMSHVTVINP